MSSGAKSVVKRQIGCLGTPDLFVPYDTSWLSPLNLKGHVNLEIVNRLGCTIKLVGFIGCEETSTDSLERSCLRPYTVSSLSAFRSLEPFFYTMKHLNETIMNYQVLRQEHERSAAECSFPPF